MLLLLLCREGAMIRRFCRLAAAARRCRRCCNSSIDANRQLRSDQSAHSCVSGCRCWLRWRGGLLADRMAMDLFRVEADSRRRG